MVIIAVVGQSSNETKAAHVALVFLRYGEARCRGKLAAYYGITKTWQVASI